VDHPSPRSTKTIRDSDLLGGSLKARVEQIPHLLSVSWSQMNFENDNLNAGPVPQ
jgi:hypothetical protein